MTSATYAENEYITIVEASKQANVSIWTIRRWLHAGLIVGRKKNRRSLLIDAGALKKFVDDLTAPIVNSSP